MKKLIFKLLAKLNKAVLPSIWQRDLTKLSKPVLIMVAWRIWVTKNAIDQ